MRKLLAYRDARLLLAGQTLSAFGDWAMFIVLAVWMKTLTGSSAAAGLVFFVLGARRALRRRLAGLLADRRASGRLMIVVNFVLAGSSCCSSSSTTRATRGSIYLVALLYGIGGTVFFPARTALLRLMLPEELLADANGALDRDPRGAADHRAARRRRASTPRSAAARWRSSTPRPSSARRSSCSRLRVREEKPEPPEHHFMREVTAGIVHEMVLGRLGSSSSGTRIRNRKNAEPANVAASRMATTPPPNAGTGAPASGATIRTPVGWTRRSRWRPREVLGQHQA